MSKWADRRQQLKSDSDYDPLTSIPMMEPSQFDVTKARLRITKAFDSAGAKNITIVDPYLLEGDIQTILHLFATQSERNITVITFLNKLKTCEQKSAPKIDTAKILKSITDDLKTKGIFNSFEIIVTNFEFHDRFFICTDGDKESIVIASGGSLSMFLTKYTSLIRITNRTFKRTLFDFIDLAKSKGSNLAAYIGEKA